MNDRCIRTIRLTTAMGCLLVAGPAYAVPSLLPLLPVLGVLVAKGALLIGSVFFLLLSTFKQRKKLYLGLGIGLFILFALAMVFVRHA